MAETEIVQVQQRKICWPDPDATCLEGGCIHCDTGPWKNYGTIANYARRAGVVPNRGFGEQDAWAAWQYGLEHEFFHRPPRRTVPKRVKA